jgi:hypothetical protein
MKLDGSPARVCSNCRRCAQCDTEPSAEEGLWRESGGLGAFAMRLCWPCYRTQAIDPDQTTTDPQEAFDDDTYQLAEPEPTTQPHPAAAHDGEHDDQDDEGGQDAQIFHLADWQTTAPIPHPIQEDSVSETTSLNSALAYTTSMKASAQNGVASVETSIASLQAGGVSGQTIAALNAAMEALNNAAAQFDAAHAALQRHIAVQESYNANPDAGKKSFVTGD